MRARVARVPWRWRVQYRAVRTARRRPDTQTRTTITRGRSAMPVHVRFKPPSNPRTDRYLATAIPLREAPRRPPPLHFPTNNTPAEGLRPSVHALARSLARPLASARARARSLLGRRTEIEFRNRPNIFVVSPLRHPPLSLSLSRSRSLSLFPACHRDGRRCRRRRRLALVIPVAVAAAECARRVSSPTLRLPRRLSSFRHRPARIHLSTHLSANRASH